jgi:hypothetical protein
MRTLSEDLLASLYDNATLWRDFRDLTTVRAHLVRVNCDAQLASVVRASAKHLTPWVVPLVMGAKDALEAIQLRIHK